MGVPGCWIGRTIAEGRYEILARIGEGSMGNVYRAHDRHIGSDVAIKVPVETESTEDFAEVEERFRREIASMVRLSHPHVVRVLDVGDEGGTPFVVMEYLPGGSLEDRMASDPGGRPRALPPVSLHDWLLDVASALDFIHSQGYLHRDVKPANILFDAHGNPFLGDFGIIKLLSREGEDEGGGGGENRSGLTSPGFLMGTPNYIAPELVMGVPGTVRVDQYSLAVIVHEVLTGRNVMQGPTPSATMVNQTKLVPPALVETVPNIPESLSLAVSRALLKVPDERYEDCATFARDALIDVALRRPVVITATAVMRGESGQAPCPGCGTPLDVGLRDHGARVRCPACGAESRVRVDGDDVQLRNLGASTPRRSYWSPHDETMVPKVATEDVRASLATGTDWSASGKVPAKVPLSRRELLLALVASNLGLLFVLARFGYLGDFLRGTSPPSDKPPWAGRDRIEINIAYGTEKQRWFEDANEEFRKTAAGRYIHVNLIPLGSLEGLQAIIDGPKPTPIHVWAPAGSATRDILERNWLVKHANSPIIRAETLALTPMVFVMWKERHEAFLRKYGRVDFTSLGEAMQEPGGWGAIAGKPDWGVFRFGHTDPVKSNSGLLALVLMAYEHKHKSRGLVRGDVLRGDFRSWLQVFEGLVSRPSNTLTHSTGTLMKEMVLRGPSQYDCVLVYENLAIDSLLEARGTWGELHVSYPDPNIWNEHPYYILDVPWSDADHHKAAAVFLDFLMSETTQQKALDRGLRPGNSAIPVNTSVSPIVRSQSYGVRVAIPPICEPPRLDVITELIELVKRIEP